MNEIKWSTDKPFETEPDFFNQTPTGMAETHQIQNINLHLSKPLEMKSNWIGQAEILKQVLLLAGRRRRGPTVDASFGRATGNW